ncbi:MAG: S8/S53 family peptidase [Flavobacteriaceae bacterium]|nr:S8/S53 family peptidase [Flavobacteriaceae bacterium]
MGINSVLSQEESWFYLQSRDSTFSPKFNVNDGFLRYQGDNISLKEILDKYKIQYFKKTYRNAIGPYLHKTFFVVANSEELLKDLVNHDLFVSGQLIPKEERKIFEPNDYGLTSTIGENLGFQINLDYLDFLGVPKAWYYTTGREGIFIGLSDGTVDTTNVEFINKTISFKESRKTKSHGNSVAAIIAAQGDNGYGGVGVCFNCSLATTTFGNFNNFQYLIELANAGVKVINCSWSGKNYSLSVQNSINKMFEQGTIIVGSSGNKGFSITKGQEIFYPASYSNVISVGTAMYRYKEPKDHLLYTKEGIPYVENIRGYVGRTAGFEDNDLMKKNIIFPISTTTLNKEVDIMAPSVGIFRYGHYLLEEKIQYITFEATSPSAPLVSGTIGLMFSLYPCLPVDEVESILKITSWNIDHIEANKPFKGMYGAGMLQTGDAVEMVYQLYNENETAYIDNQNFSRWDFKITSLSKEIVIQNQKFTDSTTLNLSAKNKIVIKEKTVLKPDSKGKISLKINPLLQKECDLVLRDPSILND